MTATFHTSQKTSAEVVIYPHNLDPIALKPKGDSRQGLTANPLARLTAVQTEKMMGAVGTWSAEVKVPHSKVREWEESVIDGDWVDIIFSRGPRRFHTMRGIVEDVDPIRLVTSSGADSLTFRISGWDHQGVFDKAMIWFNQFSEENLVGGAAMRASTLTGRLFGLGGVRETVSGVLYGFLQVLNTYGRSVWRLPSRMRNGGGEAFASACSRLYDARVDDPARVASNFNLLAESMTSPWQLAATWCDPQFNELWADLALFLPRESLVDPDLANGLGQSEQYEPYVLRDSDALEPHDTQMAVFLRRRPFPTAEDSQGIANGPWSRLPTATILPQEVQAIPLHRSGAERYNVFEVLPATVQEIVAQSVPLLSPLVDPQDVERRGVRYLSMQSRYNSSPSLTNGVSDQELAEQQRRMIRDWHCLNPRFLSGKLPLRTLRAGIRVGTVACITRNPERLRGREADDDMTFYVEGVRNSWSAPGTGFTELTVTRGYRGGDDALYDALDDARGNYRLLAPSRALTENG